MQPVRYRFLDRPQAILDYLNTLQSEPKLAIDLEADSLYSYREKVCLVQLSTAAGNTIVDPLADRDAMSALGTLLANPAITKVFHGGDYDIRLLKKDYGFQVRNVVDTMISAQFTGRSQLGLAALLEEHFDLQLKKKYQRADWSKRPLNTEQLRYAALDTAYLLQLWARLDAELIKLDRLQWAEEEFSLLEDVAPAPDHAPSCFDIKGAGRLQPRQLAILQALVELRDDVAREWDRPLFKVFLSNVLLTWAQSPPRNRKDVLKTPSANKSFLTRLASRILDAVRKAKSIPLKDCPRREYTRHVPPSEKQSARLGRLKRARQGAAKRLELSAGLLVSSKTLEHLARADPSGSLDQLEAHLKRWQMQAFRSGH